MGGIGVGVGVPSFATTGGTFTSLWVGSDGSGVPDDSDVSVGAGTSVALGADVGFLVGFGVAVAGL